MSMTRASGNGPSSATRIKRAGQPSPARSSNHPEAKLDPPLGEVVHALRRYHLALDKRENGLYAAAHFADEIERILAMPWRQGEETKRQADAVDRFENHCP